MTVRTRPEPEPFEGGRVFHVYPHGFTGAKTEPSFEGLMCAYNFWCAGTDWATAGRPRVRPGDTILVHAGVYKYNRMEYTNNASVNRTVPLDGTYYLTADGTPEMPIAIKAAGDGEVVFDGAGNFVLFDVRAADYTYFDGITFRDAEIAILAGTKFIAGSRDGFTLVIPESTRPRRSRRLRRLERLLHCRQPLRRPPRPKQGDRLGRQPVGAVQRC